MRREESRRLIRQQKDASPYEDAVARAGAFISSIVSLMLDIGLSSSAMITPESRALIETMRHDHQIHIIKHVDHRRADFSSFRNRRGADPVVSGRNIIAPDTKRLFE